MNTKPTQRARNLLGAAEQEHFLAEMCNNSRNLSLFQRTSKVFSCAVIIFLGKEDFLKDLKPSEMKFLIEFRNRVTKLC